jgi:hypothetical protein
MHKRHLGLDNLDTVRDLQERDAYIESNYARCPLEISAVKSDLACPHSPRPSAQTLLRYLRDTWTKTVNIHYIGGNDRQFHDTPKTIEPHNRRGRGSTRRKMCHMQLAKEWLRSYTTQQLKNCINLEVQQGAVVFQLYYRLGDVVVDRGDQQTSYIIPAMKTTLRWQLVAGVDTFQLYISCGGKYGKPINN